jgi:integrase
VIRRAKFGKDRLVPFGPRLGRLLEQHVALRQRRRGARARDAPLFSVRGGRAVNRHSVDTVFRQLLPHVSGPFPAETRSPRVHDLRHACAVAALLRWYRTGVDPATRLLPLSTFLGHVQPESTAVYLTITPDLLAEASRRFQPPPMPWGPEREP